MSEPLLYGGLEQEDLRAITLWRPWGECIIKGPKDIENRPWEPPPWLIGKFVAIHAGLKYDKEAAVDMVKQKLWTPPSPAVCLHSVIKGVVRVIGFISYLGGMTLMGDDVGAMSGENAPPDPFDSPWFSGHYGWLLSDFVAFPEPVPAKGMLGLWKVKDELRDKVNEQWRKALELATVVCIGDGREGAGCGADIVSDPSGATCPHCGGMLLSKAAIKAVYS